MQTLAQDTSGGDEAKAEAAPKEKAPASAAASGDGFDTVTGLLGSPEGAALRRVAMDADSMSLIWHLVRKGLLHPRPEGMPVLATPA